MGKIDLHLHISPQPIVFNGVRMDSPVEMIPHLDELGIDRGVLMSMGGAGNRDNLDIVKAYPDRFDWMCNVSAEDDPADYEAILAACKADGAIGVGEVVLNDWISDAKIQAVFAAAEKLKLPLVFHMSPEAGYSYGIADHPRMPLLEQALADYPDLVVIGHSQTFWIEISGDAPDGKEERNAWGKGPVTPGGRICELMDRYPNLYGDLSANSGGCALMRDEAFGLAFLEKYGDRLFFATDMTNRDMVFPLGAWLDDKLAAGQLSQAAYDLVCRENFMRVLGK